MLKVSRMINYAASPKRSNGQYYTARNPFEHPAFREWASAAGLPGGHLLEPFAGSNSLVTYLSKMGLCRDFTSFDIEPAGAEVEYRDTIADFPSGYDICVTNPPWLAKNSATVRGIPFPDSPFDDLYKVALDRCMDNCAFVAALVPESFIRTGLFTDRLFAFVSLTAGIFEDTGHPVGLALFTESSNCPAARVWSGNRYIGELGALEQMRPLPQKDGPPVSFNRPDGNVGLIALDNTVGPSIRFCDASELAGYRVKQTGRHITKLFVDGSIRLEKWNEFLKDFRVKTGDVLMTSYKGIRKDGKYRRRLDWQLARGIIHHE